MFFLKFSNFKRFQNQLRQLPVFFACCFILFFLFQCNPDAKEASEEIKIVNLELINTFPKYESEIYLVRPVNLAVSKNRLYLSDQGLSQILIFDFTGKFKKKLGGPGRGPKEFNGQLGIDYFDKKLFIMDQGNRRMGIWHLDNDSVSVHHGRDIFLQFAVTQNRIYTHDMLFPPGDENFKNHSVVQTFNWKMSKVNKFGEYTDNQNVYLPEKTDAVIEIFNDTLYVLFNNYPILKKFNLSGDLISSINLDDKNLKYAAKSPLNYDNNDETSEGVFRDFSINEKGMFVAGLSDDAYIIDHFTNNGKFIQRFKKDFINEQDWIGDIKVIVDENNTLKFYLLDDLVNILVKK